MKPVKIKFSDGKARTITVESINISKVKHFLEKRTGLIFGKGNLFSQAIGTASAWLCMHGPNEKDSEAVMAGCLYVAAQHYVDLMGGYIAQANDNGELLVYVPHPTSEHYVYMVQKQFKAVLFSKEHNPKDFLHVVETIKDKEVAAV